MTLALEAFQGSSSLVGRFDPRWKLAGLAWATLATALLRTVPPAASAFVLAVALLFLSNIRWRWYFARIASVLVFLALFVIWLPWLVPGEIWDMGPVQLSLPGLRLALLIVLKALAMVTFMLVLWASSPVENTLKAAHSLRVPGLLVQLVALTYRYVFLLGEEFARIRTALRVRGYRNRPTVHCYRTIGHVTGALLIRSYERAERVAQAMRCRGFNGRFRSLTEFRTRPLDVIAFSSILLSAAGLLLWDHLYQ
jgi:cobalt/nickel transport system permease protein